MPDQLTLRYVDICRAPLAIHCALAVTGHPVKRKVLMQWRQGLGQKSSGVWFWS